MYVVIDRFEGDFAVVEMPDKQFVLLPKVLVPNSKEGDIVYIGIDHNKTKQQEKKIQQLLNQVFE